MPAVAHGGLCAVLDFGLGLGVHPSQESIAMEVGCFGLRDVHGIFFLLKIFLHL